ncbi:MAG: leucine-rich repeat domain-containing protein [Ruminococcus sp.]|nr:leucine-rich repeat domain-containing protein [Ruminococcus sp.]
MRLGNIITGALLLKLLSTVVKNSRENDPDIRDVVKDVKEKIDEKIKPPVIRPEFAQPDRGLPDNFVPYEGEDMTCAEADAAGFEFVGADRYHGVDFLLANRICDKRDLRGDIWYVVRRGREMYSGEGISGCAVTGWHGKGGIVKVPRTINGRPVVKIEKESFNKRYYGENEDRNITELYLPDSVMEIGDRAFESSRLRFARLSKNLIRIGKKAFSWCEDLEKVYMGGAYIIDESAFSGCKKLQQVRLPEKVEYLGSHAFDCTGLKKFYWHSIIHAGDKIVDCSPFEKEHDNIVLGDCLQKCIAVTDGEILLDRLSVYSIGSDCFYGSSAKKITLPRSVKAAERYAFCSRGEIGEVYAPGLFKFGWNCFNANTKIIVSGSPEYVGESVSAEGYLYIEPNSFEGTHMETLYAGGSSQMPCCCTMVRKILADVTDLTTDTFRQSKEYDFAKDPNAPRRILTLSDDGSTLIMDDNVGYVSAKYIPSLGAKRIVLGKELSQLRNFASLSFFEEIVFPKAVVSVRENKPLYLRKTVIIRYKFDSHNWTPPVDSAVMLYLPPIMGKSEEADRLRELYNKCLTSQGFDFERYDGNILDAVSSYRARFTIARLRLEGGYGLSKRAKERYETFLLFHRRKAEKTAKKHGDERLLSLLENLIQNQLQGGDEQ